MSRYFQQQSDIDGARSDAANASGRATNLEDEVKHLQKRVDSLSMTCRAMWELLREGSPLTDEEITSRLEGLQQQTEAKKGQANKCTDCGRAIVRKQAKCLYCGAEVKKESLFE